jgi:hypothetical protein
MLCATMALAYDNGRRRLDFINNFGIKPVQVAATRFWRFDELPHNNPLGRKPATDFDSRIADIRLVPKVA